MNKKQFKIDIKAPREKVWNVLWSDDTYRQWTSPFSEGSKAVTDWKEGSQVLFLDANDEGMVSTVAKNIPNEFMSIKHLGMVTKGVKDTVSEEVKKWQGAMENYTLKTANGKTELTVDMDITDDHLDYFVKTWPKALGKVKEISEK